MLVYLTYLNLEVLITNNCGDCQCFRHSDLQNDRPSTVQFKEKLPWFLDALPSADCAKGGHGAYTTSVELEGWLDLVFVLPLFTLRKLTNDDLLIEPIVSVLKLNLVVAN